MDNPLVILMILWLILMWITFLVILMLRIVMMTTPLTVFLSGFASSPEPENTTMVNMEEVVGLYHRWYLFFLCWCCYLFSKENFRRSIPIKKIRKSK